MKIAFFTNTILEHGGGLEKYFIEVASELARRYPHFEVSIVTFNEKRTEMLQRSLSFYYFKKMPISSLYREKTEVILKKLGGVNYIKCSSFYEVKHELMKYDAVYSKNEIIDLSILKYFGYENLPPVIVGAHTPIRIPTVMTMHDRLHNWLYLGFPYKFLLRGTSAVHVSNGDDFSLLKNHFKHLNVYKILPPFPSKMDIPIVYNTEEKEFHILYAGRLTAQKGIDILLSCIEEASAWDIFPFLNFRLAGSGEPDYVEKIQALADKYSNVEYLGHIPNSEMDTLYQWADIVLVPSHVETANYISLEAGSNGRVVIVSDVSGPREIVKNEETGFLVQPRAEDFTQKIRDLYTLKKEDASAFNKIGERAKYYIEERFAPDRIYSQFQVMLKETVQLKKDN